MGRRWPHHRSARLGAPRPRGEDRSVASGLLLRTRRRSGRHLDPAAARLKAYPGEPWATLKEGGSPEIEDGALNERAPRRMLAGVAATRVAVRRNETGPQIAWASDPRCARLQAEHGGPAAIVTGSGWPHFSD